MEYRKSIKLFLKPFNLKVFRHECYKSALENSNYYVKTKHCDKASLVEGILVAYSFLFFTMDKKKSLLKSLFEIGLTKKFCTNCFKYLQIIVDIFRILQEIYGSIDCKS